MILRKYRVNKDWFHSSYWNVECKRLWWPFWVEVGNGLIPTKSQAQELCDMLNANQ